ADSRHDGDLFFSSRRRHTRSKRDWSSDVCSSDLAGAAPSRTCSKAKLGACGPEHDAVAPGSRAEKARLLRACLGPEAIPQGASRSEERRVGKECRSGGLADGYKKRVLSHGLSE